MRTTRNVFTVLTVLVAVVAAAAEIPDRPEKLKYPDLEFTVPDAASLRFELSDGTPVYAMPDHQFPLVNIALYFRGGQYLEPEGKEGLAAVTGEAWRTGGAGDRTAQQLDEELDFLAAVLSTQIGEVTGSVSLNVLSKDLETGLDILMDVLTRPRFQADRFAKAKDDLIQGMKRRNDDAALIEAREWDRLIYGEGYWQNRLATQASVDSLTAEDAAGFVARLIRSGNVVVAASGDFELDQLEKLLDGTIATLPEMDGPLPEVPAPGKGAAPGVYLVDKQDVNQGRVRIGQLGYELGHPDEFPLMVGNDILGGGGFTARMMKRIRSDEGLAYGAYSNITFPVTMPGTFSAFFQTKSSTVAYATKLTFDLIGQLRSAPPTAEEMTTSTASFIETFPRRFESPARTVGLYATDELLGRPHDYWTTYRDKVRAVTAADVEAAMHSDLHPDRMVVLVVGRIDEILEGHPDHEAKLADFGELHRLPLRDPLTMEPLPQTGE